MATYIVNPTEEQEKAVKAFLEALEVSFIKDDNDKMEFPAYVLAGIKESEADYEAGRYTTLVEFKKKLHMFK